jgi:NAD(P)-dependent dehydrogenase (short-subunit alcohol dehydrogenase family)
MAVTLKPINEQVIVITGATSGIGLTTARMAANAGAKVVVAARSEKDLRQLEEEINQAGGQAIAVVGDVGQQGTARQIAEAAIARFGRIDTWVNNAGVSIWGKLADSSDEDNRRLFDTDFWGVVYGSQEAIGHLRPNGGALINMGSVVSDRALPLQGMYCAAKHAVKAYTDSLRMELEEENAPISVTLIKPTGINTPFVQHAKNNMQQEPKLPPPVYAPDEVAKAILHAAQHPVRDVFVGSAARILSSAGKHAPRLVDLYMEKTMFDQQQRDEPAQHRDGTLHRAGGGLQQDGDYPGMVRSTSIYTRASLHPWMTGMLLGAAGLVVAGALGARKQSQESEQAHQWT